MMCVCAAVATDVHAQAGPQAQPFIDRARDSLKRGDHRAAIKDLDTALKLDPRCAPAFQLRGIAHMGLRQFDKAIGDFDKSIELDGAKGVVFTYRGKAKLLKGDRSGAATDFDSAVNLSPQFAPAYYYRARAKTALGDMRGAVTDLDQAVRLDEQYVDALVERGALRAKLGDLQGAIADASKAIAVDQGVSEAYYNRGAAYLTGGTYDKAAADFTRVMLLQPKDATARHMRGLSRLRLGDYHGAIEDCTAAIRLAPNHAAAHATRADARAALGLVRGAEADYTRAVELAPNSPAAYGRRGLFHYTRRQWQAALDDLQVMGKLAKGTRHADYGRLWAWLIEARQGRVDEASVALRQYVDRRARQADPWFKSIARFLLGRIAESDFLLAADSNNTAVARQRLCQAYFYAGMRRTLVGDTAGALRLLRKCIAKQVGELMEHTAAHVELRQLLLGMRVAAMAPSVRLRHQVDPGVGFVVDQVTPHGPAARAGVRVGDLLIELDGQPTSRKQLQQVAQRRQPGDKLSMRIIRDDKPVDLTLTIALWRDPAPPDPSP